METVSKDAIVGFAVYSFSFFGLTLQVLVTLAPLLPVTAAVVFLIFGYRLHIF